jgi:hypothetical protein
MCQKGAKLVGTGLMTKLIIEEIESGACEEIKTWPCDEDAP